MKKTFAFLIALLATLPAIAQNSPGADMEIKQFENNKVDSGREYYGDIPARMTKVVITGDNSMTDLLFRNAVEENWDISPFEFCSYEEFDRIKTDTNYYFLMRVDKLHRKNNDMPAMEFVCFLKGNEKAEKDISEMPELISLPLFPEDDGSDRIFSYLPAYMHIMQNYIQNIVDGRIYPARNGKLHVSIPDRSGINSILFNKEDMAYNAPMQEFERMFRGKAQLVLQEKIDKAIKDGTGKTLVSLVVAPDSNSKGSYCYKMLISADTYGLYYYNRHKITDKKGPGFLKSDLKRISKIITPKFSVR